VSGNTITGSIVDGIESRARGGAGSPEIQGNVIKGNGQYGINVTFNSEPTISHNKITGNGADIYSDIFINNSTAPHISWNVFDTISGGVDGFGQYNLMSDGTDILVP
jgi:parallel beta-helix repeat protein